MRARPFLLLAVLAAVVAAAHPTAAEDPPADAKKAASLPSLPAAWHGVWKGRCSVEGPTRKRLDFAMELHVAPIAGRKAWTWKIVYGEGETRQVRPYELVPVAGGKGHFRVDEKNGIVIDSYLVDGALYSRFGVHKSLVDAVYRLDGKQLHVSLITFGTTAASTSGGKDRVPPVASYPLRAVQRGTLTRAD